MMDDELYFSGKFDRLHAWLDLLLLTNYKPNSLRKRGITVQLEAGELAISIRDLAERWKWSVNTVQKYLNELILIHKIEIRKSNIVNVLRIINWAKYQVCDTQNDTQNDTQIKKEEKFPLQPPYKEERNKERNSSSSTERAYACAREGEAGFIEELRNSQIWKEQVCMLLKIQPHELDQFFDQFKLNNDVREISHMNATDTKRHFVDWLRIQIKQKRNETNRNNSRPNKEQRDAEFAQFIAAKFASGN